MNQLNIVLAAIMVMGSSWIKADESLPRFNTYHMYIGKKTIFSSTTKNNDLGDTVFVSRQKLKPADTLYVGVFLCGSRGDSAKVTMTIKDDQGKLIKEHSHITQRFGYSEKIAVNDILSSPQFDDNGMISVFFSIDNKKENFETSFLFGKIKFK